MKVFRNARRAADVRVGVRAPAVSAGLATLAAAATLSALLLPAVASAQANAPATSPAISAAHPYLAASPWPIAGRDTLSQQAVALPGPQPGDRLVAQQVIVPKAPREAPGPGAALLSEPYPDGTRAVWGTNGARVFKMHAAADGLAWVDSKPIDRVALPVLQRYELLLARGNQAIVADPRGRLLRFVDADPADPRSAIVVKDVWELAEPAWGRISQMSMTWDGRVVILTDAGWLVSVRASDFGDPKFFLIERYRTETIAAKPMAIDERGGIYISSSRRIMRVDWTGTGFVPAWAVDIEPVGKLVAGTPGTGTGPSLLGVAPGEDRLVVFVDSGHPCYAVALWRDDIPADWAGEPGRDRRVAAMVPAPSVCANERNGGWTAETSLAVHGMEFVAARYNGRYYGLDDPPGDTGLTDVLLRNAAGPRDPAPGVQKFRWDPATRTLDSVWRNDTVNLNSSPTVAATSQLVYGIGRDENGFALFGLDWASGEVKLRHRLGKGATWMDGGSDVSLSDDRSLLYGSGLGVVRITPQR